MDFTYYIYVLIAIVLGVFIVKKVASCMIKAVLTSILVAALIIIYYLFFRVQ
ncbi:MAG: sulfate transporter [Prevotella sp.]|nr:sulfate transporter [Prevotella sp.]